MPDWTISQPLPQMLTGMLQRLSATFPLARIRLGVLLLVGVWILSMLADIFWMAMPQPSTLALPAMMQSYQRNDARPAAAEQSKVDVAAMKAWHLFGRNQQEITETVAVTVPSDAELDAKETRLNLKLLGVMLSTGEDSYAVIEHANSADLYKVGSPIPGGQNVKLSRVLGDRVIIDNRGSFESLLLYDDSQKSGNASITPVAPRPVAAARAQVVDQRNNSELTQVASAYREQLMTNPMSLADVIRINIAKDANGNVVGYSIRPGRDRKQFADFGLQSGDIVTAVNGISLEDPAKAMELYGQLRTAREASLSIKRGSEDINVIVGLSEQ